MSTEKKRLSDQLKNAYGQYQARPAFLSEIQQLIQGSADRAGSSSRATTRPLVRQRYISPWLAATSVGLVLLGVTAAITLGGDGREHKAVTAATTSAVSADSTAPSTAGTSTPGSSSAINSSVSASQRLVTVSAPNLPTRAVDMLDGWQKTGHGTPYAYGSGFSIPIQSVRKTSEAELEITVTGSSDSIDKACGEEFTGHAEESPAAIVLYVTEVYRSPPDGFLCPAASGTNRTINVALKSALAGRKLLDLMTGAQINVG